MTAHGAHGSGGAGSAGEAPVGREPYPYEDRADGAEDAQGEERSTPGETGGEESGNNAATEAANHRARNIGAHRRTDAVFPFFVDISRNDDRDAGRENALPKTPQDEAMETRRLCQQQRRRGQKQCGGDDDSFAADVVGQNPGEGGGERHSESGSRQQQA